MRTVLLMLVLSIGVGVAVAADPVRSTDRDEATRAKAMFLFSAGSKADAQIAEKAMKTFASSGLPTAPAPTAVVPKAELLPPSDAPGVKTAPPGYVIASDGRLYQIAVPHRR